MFDEGLRLFMKRCDGLRRAAMFDEELRCFLWRVAMIYEELQCLLCRVAMFYGELQRSMESCGVL